MTFINQLANYIFISFIIGIVLYGLRQKINVFDSFITGAKQGFGTILNIFPYLMAMLVAIGMLRASGFFTLVNKLLNPLCERLGIPTEVVPLALIRPFSGSAATGIMTELAHTHGGDSMIAKIAATMMGSTETTFYVIAIYFGAISIKRTRHAIPAGLLADLAGIIASIIVCRYLFS